MTTISELLIIFFLNDQYSLNCIDELVQGHGYGINQLNITCTAHPIITKLGSYIPLVMLMTLFDFGGILCDLNFVLYYSNHVAYLRILFDQILAVWT